MVVHRKSYSQSREDEQLRMRKAILKIIIPELDDSIPDSSWLKVEIQSWLSFNSIKWKSAMNKAKLLSLVG